MNERKAKALRTELTTCIAVTVSGLNMHRAVFSDTLWTRLFPVLTILGFLLCILVLYLDFTKGTEKELEREERDERNLMIQDRASWFCWRAENVLLIVVWGGCLLFLDRNQNVIYGTYALYWVIILRYWLFFLSRWWMGRKY